MFLGLLRVFLVCRTFFGKPSPSRSRAADNSTLFVSQWLVPIIPTNHPWAKTDRFLRGIEVPLHLYANIYASGSVPIDWAPTRGGTVKYPVRNPAVRRYLRQLLPGRWQKVIKNDNTGEVHYFEYASGQIAGVKFFPS